AGAMRELLRRLHHQHWYAALAGHPDAAVRGKAAFIADQRRANWIYELPLDPTSRLLDVGCGMGSVAAALAPRVGEVVALEAVGLRVEFCRRRFAQDGLDNVRVVRADGLRLPFPPASFDAVVLNGVLEWLGHGVPEPTRDVQLRGLERIRQLLRPGGHLVVAIENRIGLSSFRGRVDHSYLRYTSLMPRWLADRVTRARRGHPYDTYTYSHAGYRRLFRQAGFGTVRTLLPIWGYNRPAMLVPPTATARRGVLGQLELSGHRRSARPRLRRLERRLRLSTLLADDFVFLLGTGPAGERGWLRDYLAARWSGWGLPGDAARLELVTLNRGVPSLLVSAAGSAGPQVVVKLAPAGPGGAAFSPARGEAAALEALAARLPAVLADRVPRLLGADRREAHDLVAVTYLDGRPPALPPPTARPDAVVHATEGLMTRAMDWLASLEAAIAGPPRAWTAPALLAGASGGGVHLGDGGERLEAAVRERLERTWPAAGIAVPETPQHGDFALSNLIENDGTLRVIDWERLGRVAHPAFDAMLFASYLALVASRTTAGWQPRTAVASLLGRGELGRAIRRPLDAWLVGRGLEPRLVPELLATTLLAYAREYGADPGRREMLGVVGSELALLLELDGGDTASTESR
ncbi:MAG: methyltransferase domain-containing protein, partial [Candidatus Eiseniibacteriota bacterium]